MSSWDLAHGIKRLAYLPALPAGPAPDGVPSDIGDDPDVFIEALRNHAYMTIDHALI